MAADDAAEVGRRDRRVKALALRIEGRSLQAIGDALGVSHEQARLDIIRAIEERGKETKAQLLAIGNGAIEAVFEGHVAAARNGDPKSAAVVISAVREHARLNGYASPEKIKHEHTGADGAPIEVAPVTADELLSRIARLAADGPQREDSPEPVTH